LNQLRGLALDVKLEKEERPRVARVRTEDYESKAPDSN